MNPTLTMTRAIKVCVKLAQDLKAYFVILLIVGFLFAIIGMFVLYDNSNSSITPANQPVLYNTTNEDAPPLIILEQLWSGQYVQYMNFNIFGNSFITTYNVMMLNSWYYLMMTNIFKNQSSMFWIFLALVMLSQFFAAQILFATIALRMNKMVNHFL